MHARVVAVTQHDSVRVARRERQLLATEERRSFAHLAVFTGSFSLDAADVVSGIDVDALQALVDKSLFRQTAEGRFFALGTIRENALGLLTESGDADELRRRHLGFYVDLAECIA